MTWFPILTMYAQVTLIASVGLLAARLLRSAAHRHSVLLAVLLCILAAPLFYIGTAWAGFSINVAAIFRAPRESEQTVSLKANQSSRSQADADQVSPELALESPGVAVQDGPTSPPVSPPERVEEGVQRGSADSAKYLRADWLLVGICLAGTLFSLLGLVRSQLKTDVILRAARPVERRIETDVLAMAEQKLNAARPLRMATTGKVAGPVVVGVLKPWILIPARYLETLSREELLHVLIHEGAHALRRDPLAALLQRIASALFWWHPLVHAINRELTRAREEVCDNFVLSCTEPEAYGTTLLRLATLSPALAQLELAIGMFDSRGKLENRIEQLLDSRRNIMTRVRFVTGAVVLGVFGLFSVLIAATRVVAENPATPPFADAATEAKEGQAVTAKPADARDAKQLRLLLTYRGESDKPFYELILSVPPVSQQAKPSRLFHQISAEQGEKILSELRESRFFEHATATQAEVARDGKPHYLLRIELGDSSFDESLGWDLGTITRLSSLRKSLEGDAAKSMDQLLARLDGLRKIWEAGEVVDDLKSSLSTAPRTRPFGIGEPIPIKLELTNVGSVHRQHKSHRFILSGFEIVVHDEDGRRVPYLGGGAGLQETHPTIKAGEMNQLEECDLSSYYYLRRPGQYSVAFRSDGLPPSNTVHFQVSGEEDLAQDGDPMGKLLPLVAGKRKLHGSPNASPKIRPGRNRVEMPGWVFVFPLTDRGVKGSKAVVWLWLTNDPAEELTPATDDFLVSSEYLGKISRWHAYLHAAPEAMEVWPTVKRDLTDALEGRPNVGSRTSTGASETAAYEKAIDQVVKKLSDDGMWTNGLSPHIDLAADAKPADVVAEAVKKSVADGDGKPYRVLHVKTVKFAPPIGTVSAALIQNDAGTRVLIFYPFQGVKGWWTRYYESDFGKPKSASPASVQNHRPPR